MDLDPAAEGQGPNPLQQVESGTLEGEICQGQCPPRKASRTKALQRQTSDSPPLKLL